MKESRTEILASSIFEKICQSKPLKDKDETKTFVENLHELLILTTDQNVKALSLLISLGRLFCNFINVL